jgi:hypothetical protein
MLFVRYVHLTRAKHIHERQTHRLVREDVMNRKGSVEKKIGRESQGAWHQDELIGGK